MQFIFRFHSAVPRSCVQAHRKIRGVDCAVLFCKLYYSETCPDSSVVCLVLLANSLTRSLAHKTEQTPKRSLHGARRSQPFASGVNPAWGEDSERHENFEMTLRDLRVNRVTCSHSKNQAHGRIWELFSGLHLLQTGWVLHLARQTDGWMQGWITPYEQFC